MQLLLLYIPPSDELISSHVGECRLGPLFQFRVRFLLYPLQPLVDLSGDGFGRILESKPIGLNKGYWLSTLASIHLSVSLRSCSTCSHMD